MKAVILCAGLGERLRPLTNDIPKPMVPIAGKPVLEYLIMLCKKHNITEIAINTSYLPEKIKEYFGDGSKFGVKLVYSFEPTLLGASGALNNFRDFLKDEPFFVIYGDAVTNIALNELMKYHKEKKGIATLSLRKKPVSKKPGSLVFLNQNSEVIRLVEKPSDEIFKELCKTFYLSNSGIYVLDPSIFDFIPSGFSDFMKDIFPTVLEKGRSIFGFMMDDFYFREIGKMEKYELAKGEIESGKINLHLSEDTSQAIFLDRDGVINDHVYEVDGKIMSPSTLEQLEILPNVKEGIKKFKDMGFKIIVITNQPGIDFGYLRREKLHEINHLLKSELGIDQIYCCTHHPKFSGECSCRKPKTGLVDQAKKDFNLDVHNSYLVGDSLSDIETGQNAHVKKTFLKGADRIDVRNIMDKKNVFPDFIVKDLVEMADKIRELEGL